MRGGELCKILGQKFAIRIAREALCLTKSFLESCLSLDSLPSVSDGS